MTKILIDRSVVEQAVKALENRESTPVEYDTYHALRAALDQPPSSYPLPDELYDSKDWRAGGYAERVEWLHTMYESAKEQIAALCAALEPQVEQEPVAWIEHEWSGSGLRQLHFERPAPTVRDEVVRPVWTPLYTHPQNLRCKSNQARLATLWGYVKPQPKREPLTDGEIVAMWRESIVGLARSIERAHGIGGEA